ncbi:ubiquitin carboxyl-terminal hydrolase 18-like [Cynara cardunculus var. scolymus]|uniref:ubiquitin carboxyl-terminal hydrolase 18-like n=1 Tax=Cynara cardunculus var. scolymus TaxID=59895 RepID=UPI000D62AAE6|nr:ubiquitin carboxyl-terminal hydrolase 18-like [Cynara cardunculus var. scolymus]
MHEYNPLDLNWYLQLGITAFAVFFGLIYLVKNTASKYFFVEGDDDPRFDSHSQSSSSSSQSDTVVSPSSSSMPGLVATSDSCVVCGSLTKKYCSRCKVVRYCSESCQKSHWLSGHKEKCEEFRLSCKSSLQGRRNSTAVALVPGTGISTQLKKILFPYEKFVELFNWQKQGFPPCGLLNCGNSCFANVVLQCLAYTRPLAAYLLEKGHRRGCRRNDWCFLCELQDHVERASQSNQAFSPINILSRLPNIGGNLGYGKQEDAHEFMRFVIDTMQSVCLDEYGGERAVHPSSQETTLIQHIFGGRLQSQVICTKCNNVSNQFENMMDLTVEIQGDAASLEECLDQFTAKEWLDGDNMYKCDGCNDYVLAWKRLNIHMPPNILTIALKRFQSGRFGKLNKRVTFPETLDLSPYMSEAADGYDKYKLYAVVVHVDMLNASYFGHYICYTKDFSGNWYRIDDCKVDAVELEEVLSQGAYMLLYSRVSARRSCLNPIDQTSKKEELEASNVPQETIPITRQPAECSLAAESVDATVMRANSLPSNIFASQKSSMDMDAPDSDAASSSVLVDDGDYGNRKAGSVGPALPVEDTFCSSTDTEASTPQHTEVSLPVCDIETDNRTDITNKPASVQIHTDDIGSSNGEEANGMDSVDFGCKPEKVESTITNLEDASRKLVNTSSSVAKLKPLISPGFLGKRPRKILSTKKTAEVSVETEQANGDLKPQENISDPKGKEKPCLKNNGSVSSDMVKSNTESRVLPNGGSKGSLVQ